MSTVVLDLEFVNLFDKLVILKNSLPCNQDLLEKSLEKLKEEIERC